MQRWRNQGGINTGYPIKAEENFTMADRITVLIVDDHDVVRQGVRAFLEAQPDLQIVGEAASGEEAIRLTQEYIPDVVLMDLAMPGMNGVEATREVRRVSPRTQVVVL